MNRDGLAEAIAERANIDMYSAIMALHAFAEIVEETVATGEKVNIVGFGCFEKRKRAVKRISNPRTGELMTVPEMSLPVFRPGVHFKEKVRSSK